MESDNLIPGLENHGIFVQVMAFNVGKYVCRRPAYYSGLFEMCVENIKLRQYVNVL